MRKALNKTVFAVAIFAFCVCASGFAKSFSWDNVFNEKTKKSAEATNEALERSNEDITPEEEYYIGRAVAAQLLTQYKVLNNTKLVNYLNNICNTLVINSSEPELYNGYHVVVLDTKEINAFATPGGHILITKGLIKSTENEEELAAVIAHEVGHIQLRHAIRAIKTKRAKTAISSTVQTAVYAFGVEALDEMVDSFQSDVGDICGTLTSSGYSKAQEFDADNAAVKLLKASGYDTDGLIGMLTVLKNNQGNDKTGMYATHPSPANRIRNVKVKSATAPLDANKEVRYARYKAALAGL